MAHWGDVGVGEGDRQPFAAQVLAQQANTDPVSEFDCIYGHFLKQVTDPLALSQCVCARDEFRHDERRYDSIAGGYRPVHNPIRLVE